MRSLPVALLVVAGCGGAASTPAPTPSCAGDRLVVSQADVDAVAACGRIDGAVTIRTAATLDLAPLAALVEVGGDLAIGPTFDLDVVHVEGVRRVGGAVRVVSNGIATGAFLPALEEAGSLEVGGNLALNNISAPALRRVRGDLVIESNPDLQLLDLSALAEVDGAFRIRENPELALIEMKGLARAGGAEIVGAKLPEGFADTVLAAVKPPTP